MILFFLSKNICYGNSHISFSYFNINLESLYPQTLSSHLRDFLSDYLFPFYTISFAEDFPFHNINLESFCILTNAELFSQLRCNFSSQKIISPSSMPFLSIFDKYNILFYNKNLASLYSSGRIIICNSRHSNSAQK